MRPTHTAFKPSLRTGSWERKFCCLSLQRGRLGGGRSPPYPSQRRPLNWTCGYGFWRAERVPCDVEEQTTDVVCPGLADFFLNLRTQASRADPHAQLSKHIRSSSRWVSTLYHEKVTNLFGTKFRRTLGFFNGDYLRQSSRGVQGQRPSYICQGDQQKYRGRNPPLCGLTLRFNC